MSQSVNLIKTTSACLLVASAILLVTNTAQRGEGRGQLAGPSYLENCTNAQSNDHRSSGGLQECNNKRFVEVADLCEATGKKQQEEQQESPDRMIDMLKNPTRYLSDMPEITPSHNPNVPEYLRICEIAFFDHDETLDRFSMLDVSRMALIAKVHSTAYSDIFHQQYESFYDLKQAAGPQVDQETCLRQLDQLIERGKRQQVEKYHSKDMNFFQLLDTFGHRSAGLLLGNVFFEGMYRGCKSLHIKGTDNDGKPVQSETRYCVASYKHTDWPKLEKHDLLNFKAGVCLPKSCDSLNYKNKYQLVMDLVKFNLGPMYGDQLHLNSLYCLPDEDSPSRSLSNSPAALLTMGALIGWITILVYATHKYNQSMEANDKQALGVEVNIFSMSNGMSALNNNNNNKHVDATDCNHRQATITNQSNWIGQNNRLQLYKMLSITNNIKFLFNTSKMSSVMETARTVSNSNEGSNEAALLLAKGNNKRIIDLRCLEGIKVIAMCYVIMGHVLMCITTLIQNGRELAEDSSLAFYIANLVPAFAVNSFFTITGILTCYLMLKQNQYHSFVSSPIKWILFIVHRYLRITPIYALVVLYTKTLAKYTGSGPFWDYGTSALSLRRKCERESWWWTLLFGSNFIPPLDHCIPSGWYLSNDFQFFLMTPFFLAALYYKPKFGQSLLIGGSVAGYLGSVYTIITSEVNDLRPIANFAPHGFKTYISHFSHTYTQPHYRIPAYLIGILFGYQLFNFERKKLQFLAKEHRQSTDTNEAITKEERQNHQGVKTIEEPEISEATRKYGLWLCAILIIACCTTPVIGSKLTFSKPVARLMVAFFNPAFHIAFGLAVGLYIKMSTTGFGNMYLDQFLSASYWKPLARMSLCALLINVEVITYLVQTNTNMQYLTDQYLIAMNILCILVTYFASTVVYVLFEAPIRALLNSMLTFIIKKFAGKQKIH